MDVPGSSSSSDSSTLNHDNAVEESSSSVLSEPAKHVVHCTKPSVKFSHSVSTPNGIPLPTCSRLAMSACEGVTHSMGSPHPHRHHSHLHCEPVDTGKGLRGAVGGESTEEQDRQTHHCHAHIHHHAFEADVDGVQELVADPEMGRLGREMDACWLDLKKRVSVSIQSIL